MSEFEKPELHVIEFPDGADAGYGNSPVERLRFIVDTIRAHLARQSCSVHTSERADLELLFGRPMAWCPACGTRLPEESRAE